MTANSNLFSTNLEPEISLTLIHLWKPENLWLNFLYILWKSSSTKGWMYHLHEPHLRQAKAYNAQYLSK